MGTRVRGFIDYHVPDEVNRDPLAMLRILDATTPHCRAVEEYWRANDPWHEPDPMDSWNVHEKGTTDFLRDGWWFDGPGKMAIQFCPKVAVMSAGARWRGFLSIPPLREVHRQAFLSTARAVGATGIIFVPDYAHELIDAAYEGKATFEECLDLIEEKWGPTQGDLAEIPHDVIAECDCSPPRVWFLEPT